MTNDSSDGVPAGAARRADERFRTLADASAAMLWLTEQDGEASFLSRAWYDFTGQEKTAAPGAGRLEAVHPDDLPTAEAAFAAAGDNREPFAIEYRLRRRDGAYRWALDSGQPRFGPDGAFLGYAGSIIDITERKRSELLDEEQANVLEAIAAGRPIQDCLRAVAEAAVRLLPNALAAGVVVEPNRDEATPGLAVIVPATLAATLRDEDASHSTPVLGPGGGAIAAARFWLAEPRAPTEWELRVADLAARAAKIALEREHRAAAFRESTARFRLAQRDLKRSREQLELLSDTVPALISYVGADRCYLTCNAEYSKWFGLPRESIVGRPMREVVGEEAWRVIGPRVERAFAGEPSEYEAEIDYRYGGKRSIHARYTPHRDAGGEVVGVVCLVTDVSARMQAAHARARLASIVDSSDDAIVGKDLDGTITSWNAGAERLFGYSAEETIGRPITMLIPEERHYEERRILERIRHGQAVKPYETMRRRKDGSLFDVSLSVSPIVDEGGRIVGASKIARDITARKRAEQDVRRSRETLNGLVDRAPFGIYIVDDDLKIVQMNARSQLGAFFGVRPVIGRSVADVMHILWPEPVAAQIVGAFRRTLETGEPYQLRDFTSQRADTENVESYEWELHRITLPDGRPGVVSYYFDSTRLRRAEQALRDADRRKDEFLATLAHELRNPLAPIRNGLQILRMTGRDPATMARIQQMLERQVDHLVRLVDDLMEVARVTRGRIELRKEAVDLTAMLRSAVETSRPLIEAARHELTVDVPAEPVTVVADPVRIAQIVANLLNNAAKYTAEGGRISLSARREDEQVVIAVRDNGIGIPVEVLPRVFDLFAQADRTYQRAQGGLGIGLTLVRTLVELHGGTVTARSDGVGRGSEFIVSLPLGGERDPRHDAPGENPDSALASHRILVVDDSRDAAESLAMLLETWGADVHTANDGAAALDELDTYRPSVMLLDIGMPGMDGLEVARRARQRPEGRDLTVIALSGWGQEEDRRRSREAGIDYHLVKPVDVDELGRVLTALAPAKVTRLRLN